jgi:pyridoxal 5'-phosphate synthase pdxT subunit
MVESKAGVLALQGDFREHRETLQRLGATTVDVRTPDQLEDVHGIVLPGGESTAISKLLKTSGLFDAISQRLQEDSSFAVLGTCAGVILSAREVLDGIADQRSFGIFDAQVRRNGVGPQRFSSERTLNVTEFESDMTAVFIRPPVIESIGPEVDVLAEHQGNPVLCTQEAHVFATFHPELTADDRVHRLFLERLQA